MGDTHSAHVPKLQYSLNFKTVFVSHPHSPNVNSNPCMLLLSCPYQINADLKLYMLMIWNGRHFPYYMIIEHQDLKHDKSHPTASTNTDHCTVVWEFSFKADFSFFFSFLSTQICLFLFSSGHFLCVFSTISARSFLNSHSHPCIYTNIPRVFLFFVLQEIWRNNY